ncbi:hypothetical protein [Dickeya lacustris]|nr:hypothetical protein [Dickeya lacustris]
MALRHSQVYEAEASIEGGMSIYTQCLALMMPTFKVGIKLFISY